MLEAFYKREITFFPSNFQLFSERWIKSESISITGGLYFILTNLISLQFCRLGIGPGSVASDFTDTDTAAKGFWNKIVWREKEEKIFPFLPCAALNAKSWQGKRQGT